MIYGNEIKKIRQERNNDAILEALQFIEEDYSQLLEEKNNEFLDESYIYINEEYKEFYEQVKEFREDMVKYRVEYKEAVKKKDKNKINNAIKNMRKTIKTTRSVIEKSDTDFAEFIISWFTGPYITALRSWMPTFVYAAAYYGVNISRITGDIINDDTGEKTSIIYYVSAIAQAAKGMLDLIDHVKIFADRINKGDILGAFTRNKRIMIKTLDDFDRIVSKLEVKSEKDLEPKKK